MNRCIVYREIPQPVLLAYNLMLLVNKSFSVDPEEFCSQFYMAFCSTEKLYKSLSGYYSLLLSFEVANQVLGHLTIEATIQKKIPTQVFSCEFFKIFKNTFFYRKHQVTASEKSLQLTISVLKSLLEKNWQ